MEHAQWTDAVVVVVVINYHAPARGHCHRVIFDVHAHIVCGRFRIRLSVHRFCICLTEQSLKHEWRAERAHDLRMARRLGTRGNLPAPSGDRGGHMRSVYLRWLGEERDLLMVPVDEYLAGRGEDIGSAAL